MAKRNIAKALPSPRMRIEHDSLGEHAVPAAAYYGIQTQRAVDNYPISGRRAAPSLIAAYGRLKWAAARANVEIGAIPKRIGSAIARAAMEVAQHCWDGQFVVDVFQAGAGVSFHMNVNEVIANRAAELLGEPRGRYDRVHPNDHVNRAQSTNDTFPTALHIAAHAELTALLLRVDELATAFFCQGAALDDVIKAGRTHLQDAVPIRLGQEFHAYGEAMREAGIRLRREGEGLLTLALGGSAAGTGLNVPRRFVPLALKHLRRETGVAWRSAPDLCAAMQSHQRLTGVSAAMRNLGVELIRIANDLRLMTSGPNTGFNEIVLPALQPGSSIMPGKINPVMPEMLTMVAFQVIGYDTTVALAAQAGQLELNVMLPAIAYPLLDGLRILNNALAVFTARCVHGLDANRERCRGYAESTLALATVLNPYIGYARVAELVHQARESGQPIWQLVQAQPNLPPALRKKLRELKALT